MFSRLILEMPTTYGNDIVYCLKSNCGVRGYCRQKRVFQFKSSANSVMRGRVNAIRTFKGLVADLETFAQRLVCILFVNSLYNRKLFRIFEH